MFTGAGIRQSANLAANDYEYMDSWPRIQLETKYLEPIHLAMSPDRRFLVQNIDGYSELVLWFKTPQGYSVYRIATDNCSKGACRDMVNPSFIDSSTIAFSHTGSSRVAEMRVMTIPPEVLNLNLMPLDFEGKTKANEFVLP